MENTLDQPVSVPSGADFSTSRRDEPDDGPGPKDLLKSARYDLQAAREEINSLQELVRHYRDLEAKEKLPESELPPGPDVLEVFRVVDRKTASRFFDGRLGKILEAQSTLSPGGPQPFTLSGVCVVCGGLATFTSDFMFASPDENGRTLPAWRERQICSCKLNCRQRSSYHLLTQTLGLHADSVVYCSEQTTELFRRICSVFPNAVGSEYLGNSIPLGTVNPQGIRNEDITRLTFADASFDCIFSLDVMEHVPDYKAGFREMGRCLKPGGRLLLTVPFHFNLDRTVVRASFAPDGTLTHHLPPVYHGDPLDPKGVLCFNDYGWDMMDDLRAAGFPDATMFVFTAPQYGYIGLQYIILATRHAAPVNGSRLEFRWQTSPALKPRSSGLSNSPEELCQQAIALCQAGKWDQAGPCFHKLTQIEPGQLRGWQGRIECAKKLNQKVLESIIRSEALEQNPEWAAALNGTCASLPEKLDPRLKGKLKTVSLAASPTIVPWLNALPETHESLPIHADTLFRQKVWLEAGQVYAEIAELLPDDLEAVRRQLECCRNLNQTGPASVMLAKTILDLALSRHPEWKEALSVFLPDSHETLPAIASHTNDWCKVVKPAALPAVLILHSEEHEDFLKLVESKLSDRYPHGELLCLVPNDDLVLAEAMESLKLCHARLKSIGIRRDWKSEQLKEMLKTHLGGRRAFWLGGDDKCFSQLAEPKPMRIQKDETLDDYLDAEDAGSVPAAYPQYVNIALTSVCNYKCFFCSREKAGSIPHLPLAHLKSLRKLIEEVDHVDLTSPGESLIYPHIREAIEFITATNRKQGIQLTTTGLLLTEELALLLSKRLSQLTFSLNAATARSYERDMGVKRWNDVLNNIRTARKHIPREKLSLSYVLHRDNLDELPDFIRLAAELDAWHVRIVGMSAVNPANVRKTLWFCKERARAAVLRAKELGKKLNVIVSDMYETVEGMSNLAQVKCVMPTFGAYIRLNGDVWPCCYSYPQVMGNIHQPGGFEAVWNGKKYRKLRKSNYFSQCQNCPAIHSGTDRLDDHIASHVLAEARAQLPLITVIIPKLESTGALQAAITSLKNQTYPVWEAVLVLNSETGAALRNAALEHGRKDPRIRFLDKRGESNFPATIQQALEQASGKIYCWMETPFTPQQLEENLKTIETTTAGANPTPTTGPDSEPMAPGTTAILDDKIRRRTPIAAIPGVEMAG